MKSWQAEVEHDTPFETWQITPELRWHTKIATSHRPGTQVLEQAWKSPDGRLQWREVPHYQE